MGNYLICRDHELIFPDTAGEGWRKFCKVGGEELLIIELDKTEGARLKAKYEERWGRDFLVSPFNYSQETGRSLVPTFNSIES